jgi:hypothetical protein
MPVEHRGRQPQQPQRVDRKPDLVFGDEPKLQEPELHQETYAMSDVIINGLNSNPNLQRVGERKLDTGLFRSFRHRKGRSSYNVYEWILDNPDNTHTETFNFHQKTPKGREGTIFFVQNVYRNNVLEEGNVSITRKDKKTIKIDEDTVPAVNEGWKFVKLALGTPRSNRPSKSVT